jgi:hypothetical protein
LDLLRREKKSGLIYAIGQRKSSWIVLQHLKMKRRAVLGVAVIGVFWDSESRRDELREESVRFFEGVTGSSDSIADDHPDPLLRKIFQEFRIGQGVGGSQSGLV